MSIKEIAVLDKGKVALLEVMGTDASIAEAARISYSSNKAKPTSSDKTLIRHLLRHAHTSCFEMVEFKFYLKMPIFVHNQWVRHRTASQNVMSGRYSEMPDEFYIPAEDTVTFQNPNNKQGGSAEVIDPTNMKNPDEWFDGISLEDAKDTFSWEDQFRQEQELVRKNYEKYLGSGMRKELARINLPLAQYTELYWKVDLHNLFHFLRLRLDDHAQYEIRVFAEAIAELIKEVVPIAYEAFEDYILHAVKLTSLDQMVMSDLMDMLEDGSGFDLDKPLRVFKEETVRQVISDSIDNKREQEECFQKIRQFFYIIETPKP